MPISNFDKNDFDWSILGLELEVRVDDSEINLEQTVGNGERPNRWDTPRMEWLISQMDKYSPKRGFQNF